VGFSGVVEVVEFLDIFPIWKNFHLAFSPLRVCGAGCWTCAVVGLAVMGLLVVGHLQLWDLQLWELKLWG